MASLPTPNEVAHLLATMLRRPVKASVRTVRAGEAAPAYFSAGVYATAHGQAPVAACLADLAFSAYSGAAFSMIPAGAARDCIKAGELDEFMQDNYGEVLNVLSRLFGEHDNLRITLTGKHFPPQDLPQPGERPARSTLELLVDIDGYGSGQVRLCLL